MLALIADCRGHRGCKEGSRADRYRPEVASGGAANAVIGVLSPSTRRYRDGDDDDVARCIALESR